MKINSYKFIAGTFSCAMLTLSTEASFLVSPGQSIQQAIDAAAVAPGANTILVEAGHYEECLIIDDPHPLKIQGLGDVTVQCLLEDENGITAGGGGSLTLENISVTGANDGINASDLSSLTLIQVVVSGSGDEGLDAEEITNVQIIASEFSGNDDKGAQIEMTQQVKITDSIFTSNGDHGLQVENDGGGEASILNCHSEGNDGDGYRIEDIASVLFVNTASIGNDDGLDLDGIAQVEIRKCRCEGNEDEGIEGDDNGTVQIVATICNENGGEGIDLDNVNQIILANVSCAENEGNGFQAVAEEVTTGSIVMLNCAFQANDKSGIELAEEEGVIESVLLNAILAEANAASGLDILISGTLSQHAVISKDNGEPDILP